MFKIDDLWRIIRFLKDGTTSPKLSNMTTVLASSEKEIVSSFFESILDQPVFLTEDYNRLRSMFIDWYASHRTMSTTQKRSSDVHTLPNDHLSELFRSFGFEVGLNLVPLTAKANFFLDLVNFYKKKGTPETLIDVLDYYGFSDTDLVEYWLQKDQFGNLIFRADSVRLASTGSTILADTDVPFNRLTENDPHWMLTESQIEQLILSNKINLPSKSPYYSLSSTFYLYRLNCSIAIMSRIVQDQYIRYNSGLSLPQNVPIKNVGEIVSLLEVYLSSIYVFEQMFGVGTIPSYTNFDCYNGTIEYVGDPPLPINLSQLVDDFNDLLVSPTSRADRDSRIITLHNDWSRPLSGNFLNVSSGTAESILNSLNPDLIALYDTWFSSGDQNYLISYLIGTLDNWIRVNVDSKSPSLVITMLGLGFREELDQIVDFFKPYRARLAYMDTAYSIKNPLTESILLAEEFFTDIYQYITEVPIEVTDDFFTDIYQSFHDNTRGGFFKFLNYDSGGFYDMAIKGYDKVDIWLQQKHEDVINIYDGVGTTYVSEFRDYRLDWPNQYDIGQTYDTQQAAAMVTDSVWIFPSSLGVVNMTCNIDADLTIGIVEVLSSTVTITSDTSVSTIEFGSPEVLSSTGMCSSNCEAILITTDMPEFIDFVHGYHDIIQYDIGLTFDTIRQTSIVTDGVEIVVIVP